MPMAACDMALVLISNQKCAYVALIVHRKAMRCARSF